MKIEIDCDDSLPGRAAEIFCRNIDDDVWVSPMPELDWYTTIDGSFHLSNALKATLLELNQADAVPKNGDFNAKYLGGVKNHVTGADEPTIYIEKDGEPVGWLTLAEDDPVVAKKLVDLIAPDTRREEG